MSLENITSRFVDLGLDQEEAAVLRDLYLSGESKAGDLAKSCGLARIKVYRILERLQEMNIVESTMGRPVMFSAIPAESAIEKLIGHAAKKLEKMESARHDVIQELAKFKLHQKPQVEAKYKIVQGKSQVYSMIAKMAGAARSVILAYVEREDLMKIAYTEIPEEFAKARKRGAKVMILTDVDFSLEETIKEYSEFAEIRHTKIPGMSMLLVTDDSELVVSAMTRADSASGDVALWMNGRNFVAGIRGLLGDSWQNAVDARTRINIMKEGGKALEDILIVKGTQPISELYRSMLARAKRHVLHISVPYDAAFFDSISRDTLAGAGKKLKVRVLTAIEKDSLGKVRALERCEVRHVDAKAGVNITLADDEVMLTPAAGSRGQSAIWSSVRDYVDHYSAMFESLWSSSSAMSDRIKAIEDQEKAARALASAVQLLKGAGFEIQKQLKGASGLSHEFAIVAQGKGGTVVLDIAGQDTQAAVIGFLVKCMDVKADHKILVTLSDPSAMRAPAKSFQSDLKVVGAGDIEEVLRGMLARWQPTSTA
ncbi:helix-turn-helix domain-containing protein [Nitrososphaera sp.]|uniref:TrmB family transcriptional regulator n=1 Tax=Nitrososphaera sp. TaxID=1971748 RepID=UPI00317966AA